MYTIVCTLYTAGVQSLLLKVQKMFPDPHCRTPAPEMPITTVRLPKPLRDEIVKAAAENRRTESAEIRARLAISFSNAPAAEVVTA